MFFEDGVLFGGFLCFVVCLFSLEMSVEFDFYVVFELMVVYGGGGDGEFWLLGKGGVKIEDVC